MTTWQLISSSLGVSEARSDQAAGGGGLLIRRPLLSNDTVSSSRTSAPAFWKRAAGSPGGTPFNFTTVAGAGIAYRLNGSTDLPTGVRYFHLSNARLEGPERNPSINGITGYLGMIYKF